MKALTRRDFIARASAAAVASSIDLRTTASPPTPPGTSADVVIYGASSAGVIAAVQAVRMGKTVILLEPSQHVGGLTTGGLGATDMEHKEAYGGLPLQFYRRVARHYARPEAWFCQDFQTYYQKLSPYHRRHLSPDLTVPNAEMFTFEPKVASTLFAEMLKGASVTPRLGARIKRKGGVEKKGNRIGAIRLENGERITGRMFIDATYEGDLMAEAKVSYFVGREANSVYGEHWNGAQPYAGGLNFVTAVDPYKTPGKPESGLLWGIDSAPMEKPGTGDSRIQAYTLRLTLTDYEPNRIPITQPDGYDPAMFELLARYQQTGKASRFWYPTDMPNRKTDTNSAGAFSADFIGGSHTWPEGDYTERDRLYRLHRDYLHGWLWYLRSDPRVPEKIRAEASRWGLCKDEFTDNGGWTPQVYVREARRMIGHYVMTERECIGEDKAPQSVALGCYGLDSHHNRRFVRNGAVRAEGNVQVGNLVPYSISYGAILPKESECANLLVPICLSASHMAYGSIRMEPVFMTLAQSAATAAAMALDANCALQQLPYPALRQRLLADGLLLENPKEQTIPILKYRLELD